MEKALDEQEQPFLTHNNDDNTSETSSSPTLVPLNRHHYRSSRILTIIATTLSALLLTSLLTNIYLITRISSPKHQPDSSWTPFSPASVAQEYTLTSINTHSHHDAFGGPPGPEFDRAWSELLLGASIQVSADELRRAGKRSLKLGESDGYVAYLDSYHQLHCVKRMVQMRWPESYPEIAALGSFTDEHFNHCIQVLRKGIMCSGDTTLNTYVWNDNVTMVKGVSDAPRKCVDWTRLSEWARSRAVLGDAYVLKPDEEGFMGPD